MPGADRVVLAAHELYRFFHAGEDETLALRGVSVQFHEGEIVAVMGPSGSGKSTLLACLAGLDEPDGGYVELLCRRLTRRPEIERTAARTRDIGVMLQSGSLLPHLSVEGNIRAAMLVAARLNPRRIDELLELTGLSERRHSHPGEISGGEEARASLAVALANAPRVLLADEPTGVVDSDNEQRILAIIKAYCSLGGTAVIATHSSALAAHADRIISLSDGKVVRDA